MESSTTVMAFDGQRTSLSLHRKVVTNRSGSVAYEIKGC